jgi:hypothetical protein
MATSIANPILPSRAAATEIWFRRVLWTALILTAAAILISCGVMLWARNEFTTAESVVAAQSLMLEHSGTLYYDLNHYPYTVAGYMPIFYWLEAGLIRLGVPAFASGRMITMTAFLVLIGTCRRTALLYTEDQIIAWMAALLVASSPQMFLWSVTGQVDILAVSFAALAFYHFSRYYVRGEPSLSCAALFALLALFTKQTSIAAPAAIFLSLFPQDRKKALHFAATVGGGGGALVMSLNAALHGHLLQDTVQANMNPLSWWKFVAQLQYVGMLSGCLLLMAVLSFRRLAAGLSRPLCLYAACAAAVFLATCGKVGSDTNYQLEMTVVLAECAAVGLHRLDFLPLYFAGSKRWITLLVLPLAIHVVNGYRVLPNLVTSRVASELAARAQLEELRPYVQPSGGLVLSSDYSSMVRLRQRMDVEPLIYGLLVRAGAVDPEPVRRDLIRGAFSAVILTEDISQPPQDSFLEFIILPASQRAAIRQHYRLVKHISGPFERELFVYQPSGS